MITTTLFGVSAVLLIAAVGLLLYRRRARLIGESQEPWPEVSAAKYRPMERLLAAEDCEFLARQPGYTARMGRVFRAERRRILKQYLKLMAKDVNRVYAAAKLALMQCPEDRPHLAAALIRLRLEFLFARLALRCRLALHPFGLPSLDLRRVLGALERIADVGRQRSAQLAPASAAALR